MAATEILKIRMRKRYLKNAMGNTLFKPNQKQNTYSCSHGVPTIDNLQLKITQPIKENNRDLPGRQEARHAVEECSMKMPRELHR